MSSKIATHLNQLAEMLKTKVDWSKSALKCADVEQIITDPDIDRVMVPVKPHTSPREAVAFARALFLELKQQASLADLIAHLSVRGPVQAARH
jgi:hypothetical protein